MNTMLNDIRYALRQLSKSPGFAVTAVLTLALGIGALTTVATWTNAVLYNPWPHVAAPSNIRFVDATVLGSEGYSVHYDQFRFLREQGHSFSDAIAFELTIVNLSGLNQQPRAISAGTVSSNYFQFLGIQPQVGRFFRPVINERASGASDEIVLSDGLWRERFAADPNIAGRTVEINRHLFTVIGVAPRSSPESSAGFQRLHGFRSPRFAIYPPTPHPTRSSITVCKALFAFVPASLIAPPLRNCTRWPAPTRCSSTAPTTTGGI